MKSLGFRNFRKFLNLEQLELGRVNVLVGENNSGKSTFTKATLLLAKFLKNNSGRFDQIPQETGRIPYNGKEFSFSSPEFRNVYIDTFYQALSSNADSGVIRFYSSIADFEIELSVAEPQAFRNTDYFNDYEKDHCNDDENDLEQWTSEVYPIIREEDPELYRKELSLDKASIICAEILDKKRCMKFILNYEKSRVNIDLLDANDLKKFEETQLRISEVEKFSREYYILLHELDDITKNLCANAYSVINQPFTKPPKEDIKENNELGWLMSSIESERRKAGDDISKLELLEKADAACKEMYRIFDEFTVEYIYAHSVHQFSSYRYDRNDNDYVDQTISLYYDKLVCAENTSPDDVDNSDRFVERWMLSLGIGEQFEIKQDESHGNRLAVYIYDDGVRQDLSSKGIGAIQMFLLLLRIALIIFDGNSKLKVIIVEEPEQNLHPALQSKLADFFYEVSQMSDCQFLIETHSEYMVRRMQVMVSERDMRGSDNGDPFKVFYFPADGEPYDMCFLSNGMFKNHFGSGFYDVAGDLDIELFSNVKK